MQIFSVLEFLFCLKEDSLSEMRLEKTRGNDIKFDIREYISE